MYLIPPWRLSSVLLVPGPVCRLHCLDVLVEGAVVGVLDVSEVVGEFLVGEEVFDYRLGVGFLGYLAGEVSFLDLRNLKRRRS